MKVEHLNEHDQVEIIKRFWNKFGNWIVGIIVVIALGISGWHFWQVRQGDARARASVQYEMALSAFNKEQTTRLTAQVNSLAEKHADSIYAALGKLLVASSQVKNKQYAQAEQSLRWVLKHNHSPIAQAAATLRLARLLTATGKAQQALPLLTKAPSGFGALFAVAQGDAYQALKEHAKAHTAYAKALSQLSKTDPLYHYAAMQAHSLPMQAQGK